MQRLRNPSPDSESARDTAPKSPGAVTGLCCSYHRRPDPICAVYPGLPGHFKTDAEIIAWPTNVPAKSMALGKLAPALNTDFAGCLAQRARLRWVYHRPFCLLCDPDPGRAK